MIRRSFLSSLAALPFLGWLVPKQEKLIEVGWMVKYRYEQQQEWHLSKFFEGPVMFTQYLSTLGFEWNPEEHAKNFAKMFKKDFPNSIVKAFPIYAKEDGDDSTQFS